MMLSDFQFDEDFGITLKSVARKHDLVALQIVDPAEFRSKSVNTPFGGEELIGRADTVIVGGKIKHRAESTAAAAV